MTARKLPGQRIPAAEYQQIGAVNYSTLKHMAQSPLHYWWALNHPQTETPAMLLGRATHTAVLEPDRLPLEYAVWDGDRRGAAYAEFERLSTEQGKAVLKTGDYQQALSIRDAVRGHAAAAAVLAKGRAEVSLYWQNHETGMNCKGRLDWIAATGAIIDLKTTASIDPGWFAAHAWRMGYFHQAAMYQEGYAAESGGTILRCGIIAVEQKPPHGCRLYWLDTAGLAAAWDEYIVWLRRVQDCTRANRWPGPEPLEMELPAPAWALTGEGPETDVDFDGVE